MPITENKFTADELSAAITADPTLLDVTKSVLTGQKMVIRSEDEENTFKGNLEKQVKTTLTNEHAQFLERDTEELFGIKKSDPSQKYYDYFKTAASTKMKELQDQITTLQAGGKQSDLDKQRIETLQKQLSDKEAEWTGKLTETEKKVLNIQLESSASVGLAKIRPTYLKSVPEGVVKAVEAAAISNLKGMAQEKEGRLVFVGEDGKVLLDTQLEPLTAEAVLPMLLKDLIDTGRKQPGAGSDPEKGNPNEPGKFTDIPADVKTKVQLTTYLRKAGFVDGTKEWNEVWAREDVTKLPLQ